MRRSIILLFALVVIIIIPVRVSLGGTIVYGWTGTISPREAGVDPWDIGPARRPFTILAIVEMDARDLGGPAFVLSDATLLIEGLSQPSFESGRIDFDDDPNRDSISITLEEVEINGVSEDFVTSARLPTSTFTFTNVTEPPPLFPPTRTSSGGGQLSSSSSYRTEVPTGVTITSALVPEPSTFVLGLFALLGLRITFWRKRSR